MPLHGLTDITLGVSDPLAAAEYYTEFGLTPLSPVIGQQEYLFATSDGGQQLRIVHTPVRSLVSLGLGADDHDDLHRIAASLKRIDVPSRIEGDQLRTNEPLSGLEVVATVAPPVRHHAQADAALQHPRRHPPGQRPSSIAAQDGTGPPPPARTRGPRILGQAHHHAVLHRGPRIQAQ